MRLSWIVELDDHDLRTAVDALKGRLSSIGHEVADPGDADVVLVWADRALSGELVRAVTGSDVPVVLAGPTLTSADPQGALAEAAGVYVAGLTPTHDIRLRAQHEGGFSLSGHEHAGDDHLGRHDHVRDRVTLVDKVADDVEVLRFAQVGLVAHPVMTWRSQTATGVWTLGTVPASVDDRIATRALLELVHRASDHPVPSTVRVGLLGYGAIGHEHSRAVRSVEGLELTAVCDSSAARLAAAEAAAPGIVTVTDADALLARDDVDLVVVSTPPSTHASWALRAIRAGKHVVVEKPFAIRTEEADAVLAEAEAAGRVAVVYQNRRFDPDHLAVRRAIAAGALGEVFHIETFVGGYGHPCNFWHSDAEVSGGAIFDWGSHVLDQLLDLVPGDVEFVTAANHKLRWHDVTNADHSRVTLRMRGGVEAEFVYSDLAAALKPKWYVLGTEGAVVGQWRTERVVARGSIGTLDEDVLAPADSPADLFLHAPDGSVTAMAVPPVRPGTFHRELADSLLAGLPTTVTAESSRRVVAVMEAAERSAAADGRPEVPR